MSKVTRLVILLFFGFFMSGPPSSFSADDEANKKILKDAITGAVTGAVAVEATKDEGKKEAVSNAADQAGKAKKHKNKFVKNKKRPYGWDQGKKVGWDGGDEPPGLAKKNK